MTAILVSPQKTILPLLGPAMCSPKVLRIMFPGIKELAWGPSGSTETQQCQPTNRSLIITLGELACTSFNILNRFVSHGVCPRPKITATHGNRSISKLPLPLAFDSLRSRRCQQAMANPNRAHSSRFSSGSTLHDKPCKLNIVHDKEASGASCHLVTLQTLLPKLSSRKPLFESETFLVNSSKKVFSIIVCRVCSNSLQATCIF